MMMFHWLKMILKFKIINPRIQERQRKGPEKARRRKIPQDKFDHTKIIK